MLYSHLLETIVNYVNGSETIYTGTVKKVSENEIVIIDHTDAASVELWNAGFSIGHCIAPSQLRN